MGAGQHGEVRLRVNREKQGWVSSAVVGGLGTNGLPVRRQIQQAQHVERTAKAKKQMPVAADIPAYEGGLSHLEVHEDPRFPPELWNSDSAKGRWIGAGRGEREFEWKHERDAKQRALMTPATPAARSVLPACQPANLEAVTEEDDRESYATDAWLDRASSGVLSHEALDKQASEWVAKAGKFVEEEAHEHAEEHEGEPHQKARVGALESKNFPNRSLYDRFYVQ